MRFNDIIQLFGQIAVEYYAHSKAQPKQQDFEPWLHTLPTKIAKKFRKDGFRNAVQVLPFRRYVAEKNGLSFDQFHQERLSPELWQLFQEVQQERESED